MEQSDEQREDSHEGLRRELADHRVEDARFAGQITAAISAVESKLAAMEVKLSTLWKLLLLLIGIGIVNGIIAAKPWH